MFINSDSEFIIFFFRNMKEQEILLDKYTNSEDTKNITLSETLYQELDQVSALKLNNILKKIKLIYFKIRNEINELQVFLKNEKKELSILLKQYKLA